MSRNSSQNKDQIMRNTARRTLCVFLGALLLLQCVSFLPGSPAAKTASAETQTASVDYIDAGGHQRTAYGVTMLTEEYLLSLREVDDDEYDDGNDTGEGTGGESHPDEQEIVYFDYVDLKSGWYAVSGKLTSNIKIRFRGSVHLILCDGAEFIVSQRVSVSPKSALSVYGQANGTGLLSANMSDSPIYINPASSLTINGGTVRVTSKFSAAICGHSTSHVTINGGSVQTASEKYGAGIGGDTGSTKDGLNVIITGGTVTASAAAGAEAIGHGVYGSISGGLAILGMKVAESAGSISPTTESERIEACRSSYVKLVPCDEHDYERSICRYCGRIQDITYTNPGGTVLHCESAVLVPQSTSQWGTGWLVLMENITFDSRIEVVGDVNLILCDGVTLSATQGVHVPEGASLTIWPQSGGTGKLIASSADQYQAGIGGNKSDSCGTVTINGGIVTATGSKYGAGIGCGNNGTGGLITINGGTVTATGSSGAAGIGGKANKFTGQIIIRGGTVTAQSGSNTVAAIGNMLTNKNHDSRLFLEGMKAVETEPGTVSQIPAPSLPAACSGQYVKLVVCREHDYVNSVCRYCGNAIPISYSDSSSTGYTCDQVTSAGMAGLTWADSWIAVTENTTINDRIEISGTVNMILCDGTEMNALQGIHVPAGASLIVWPQQQGTGKLSAAAKKYFAGIGGNEKEDAGIVIIHGGTVNAAGGESAAGIGRGKYGAGGTVVIRGGTVKAEGGNNAAGIGGGYKGDGGTVTITGGHVTAIAGTNAEAIGGGKNAVDSGQLTLSHMRVRAGGNQSTAEDAGALELNAACRKAYAELVPCSVHEYEYGICRLCGDIDVIPSVTYVNPAGEEKEIANWMPAAGCSDFWGNGWYAVTQNSSVAGRINVSGIVNLILCDGATLNAARGIHVPKGAKLIIWAQRGGTGILAIPKQISSAAGIGGNYHEDCGEVIINGGKILTAAGTGAGIGGGGYGSGGSITINGGIVTATGNISAGIGEGYYGSGGAVTINGGTVSAVSKYGAAIGGGAMGDGGRIIINGGRIAASALQSGAGIGGGGEEHFTDPDMAHLKGGAGGNIVIRGGRISAASVVGFGIGPGRLYDYDECENLILYAPGDGEPGTVTLSWNNENNYIEAETIVAKTYTLEKPFFYSRNGEIAGTVTAENLPAKAAGDILVPHVKPDAGLSFAESERTAVIGDTFTLEPVVAVPGGEGVFTWRSDAPEVASVDENGTVTAVAPGTAVISAVYESAETMGEASVTVTVLNAHAVTVNPTEHGTAQASPASALPGETVTLTLAPEAGYRPGNVIVTCGDEEVAVSRVTEGDDTAWSFIMPDGDALVSAAFCETEKYTILFLNYNGEYTELLQATEVAAGITPEYTGPVPERAQDEQYTYTFKEWLPAAVPVTEDAVYVAEYTAVPRRYPVTFRNWDDEILQAGEAAYGTVPAYTGDRPERPADNDYAYTFSGWTPKIAPVTGETTYTAAYDRLPLLRSGQSTVLSLKTYEPLSCSFTPAEDSYYRFRSEACAALPIVKIYDGDELIALDVDWRGGNFTFDCMAELEGGKTYTVEVMSLNADVDLTVSVQPAQVHTITVAGNDPNGTVEIEGGNLAYVGKTVFVVPIPYETADENCWLAKVTAVTTDGELLELEDWSFIMPDKDVTVSGRYALMLPITVQTDAHSEVFTVETNLAWSPEDAKAVPGAKARIYAYFEDGYLAESVTVTGTDGTEIACDYVEDEERGELYYLFTMPDMPVTVEVTSTRDDRIPEFEDPDFVLPAGVITVEDSAFENDESICVVLIPANCRSIGKYAFRNCTDLFMIRIPAGCSIGTGAFSGCDEVYIFGTPGSPAEEYCQTHKNCTFVYE